MSRVSCPVSVWVINRSLALGVVACRSPDRNTQEVRASFKEKELLDDYVSNMALLGERYSVS